MKQKPIPIAANDHPGAEAAEPSPGHGDTKPSAKELDDVEQMYRGAAKKLAEKKEANPDKPLTSTRPASGD